MMPRTQQQGVDAMLIALSTISDSIDNTEESAADAALLMRDFVLEASERQKDDQYGWVMLFAAAGQIVRRMLEKQTSDPAEQKKIIEALRREMLLETV